MTHLGIQTKDFTNTRRAITHVPRAAKPQGATSSPCLGEYQRDALTMSNALAAERKARMNANTEGLV